MNDEYRCPDLECGREKLINYEGEARCEKGHVKKQKIFEYILVRLNSIFFFLRHFIDFKFDFHFLLGHLLALKLYPGDEHAYR